MFSRPFSTAAVSPFVSGPAENPPYAPYTEVEGGVTLKFYSISAMSAYRQRSFEEIRLDDYGKGRKGKQVGPASTFGTAQCHGRHSSFMGQQQQPASPFTSTLTSQQSPFGKVMPSNTCLWTAKNNWLWKPSRGLDHSRRHFWTTDSDAHSIPICIWTDCRSIHTRGNHAKSLWPTSTTNDRFWWHIQSWTASSSHHWIWYKCIWTAKFWIWATCTNSWIWTTIKPLCSTPTAVVLTIQGTFNGSTTQYRLRNINRPQLAIHNTDTANTWLDFLGRRVNL